jgi:hypothetical protein
MKKDDDLLSTDDGEDIFNLSLDDLEPEGTILETHNEESDEEIIELLDLVEKGNIGLEEEGLESLDLLGPDKTLAENDGSELKIEDSLDLTETPLEQKDGLDSGEIETIEELDFSKGDLESLLDKEVVDSVEKPQQQDDFFQDIDESDFKDLMLEEPDKEEGKLENKEVRENGIKELKPNTYITETEKTILLFKEAEKAADQEEEMALKELGEATEFSFMDVETAAEPAPEEAPAPEIEEILEPLPIEEEKIATISEEKIPGISEEKIEAIIRKVVEEVVERVARETMTSVAERVARETMTSVAETLITGAISDLKKSIDSASD